MKNIGNILIALLSLFAIMAVEAQDYCMTAPVGFGRNTTGGANGSITTVSTYNALKTALNTTTTPSIILVSGTIEIPGSGIISVKLQNKTILGLPGATLVSNARTGSTSGILNLKDGSQNVIIRNLTFVGPGAYDDEGRDLLCSEGCTNLWVDHCDFQDGMDGNFDNKGKTDNVTVSWCKFGYKKAPIPAGVGDSDDHRFSNLIGSSKSDAPADKHFSMTFLCCYWSDGCRERMPRARNAELHILNCYYYTSVSSSLALGLGGGPNGTTCYVENTDFEKIGNVYKSYDNSDGGSHTINFINCLHNTKSNVGAVSKPSYTYTALPVGDVKSVVTGSCGAGATLNVSASGQISSPCMETTLPENPLSGEYVISQTGNLLSVSCSEIIKINLYSLLGHKFSRLKISQNTIDVQSLRKGIYILSIQTKEGKIFNKKVKI
jgi:pectate lyase